MFGYANLSSGIDKRRNKLRINEHITKNLTYIWVVVSNYWRFENQSNAKKFALSLFTWKLKYESRFHVWTPFFFQRSWYYMPRGVTYNSLMTFSTTHKRTIKLNLRLWVVQQTVVSVLPNVNLSKCKRKEMIVYNTRIYLNLNK